MPQSAPFGFQAGQSRRSVNEYYVQASDTTTLAVGDPVKTNGNVFVGRLPDSRQSSGMLHVTKAASGNAVRGVIVGIVAGPGDNSAQSIPATKQRAYTVLVNDNPQALWDVQADNTAPLSAMAGMYASYAVGGPLGSVSSTVVDADSIGSTVSDLLIAEVLRNGGANSLLRVAFVQHEMAAAGGSPQIGAQIQSLVSKAGNDPAPAVRPGRGYVVAADFRAANVAASIGSPVITDVERIAPDGTKLRGIRLASSGSGTNCSFDINIRSSTFATGRLSLLVYSDHTTTGFDPNVALYVGDGASLTNHFVGNTWLANSRGWQTIAPGITGGEAHNKWIPANTAAWGTTAFTRVRVRLDYTATNTPWIEVYELNYNEDATSWLSITVDDGWDTAYTLGAPAFERYGMRASFAIIADLIGTAGYMTLAQLQDLRDRGHECVVHGPTGGTGSLVNYIASGSRLAAVTADVKFHRDYLVSNGLNVRGSANCYAFPQGYDRFAVGNEDIRDALESQGFIGGRRSAFSRQQKRSLRGGNPWTWHTIGHEWTNDPAEAANITTIVSRINGAATEKFDACLMLHKFVTGAAASATEINMTNLETLLQAIADNRAAGTQDCVLFSRLAYAMAGLERPLI